MKVLIFSFILLHLSILIASRVALQALIIRQFNSIRSKICRMADVFIHTRSRNNPENLGDPAAPLLCSEKHDRNEKLLVKRPRLRKRQQETGAPPGGSKMSRKPRKLIHDAAHL